MTPDQLRAMGLPVPEDLQTTAPVTTEIPIEAVSATESLPSAQTPVPAEMPVAAVSVPEYLPQAQAPAPVELPAEVAVAPVEVAPLAENIEERKKEILPDLESEKKPAPEQVKEGLTGSASPAAAVAAIIPKDPMIAKIEQIMIEDVEAEYKKMTPGQQAQFRQAGEETAGLIRVLLNKTKVNIKKIVKLIIKWLKLISGVNRYFLMQEAKIKADKIVSLKDKIT